MRSVNSYRKRGNIGLGAIILLYFIVGLILLPLFRHQIDADGISYISIAQKYLHGDFSGAVNGYWGPLLSWLLVPFIAVGFNGLVAAKIIGLFTGGLGLIAVYLLAGRFDISASVLRPMFFVLVAMLLSFFLPVISPDLLVAVCLCFYLYVVFGEEYAERRRNAVFAGFWGAMAFFSKSYAFPFFIVHFPLMTYLHHRMADSSRIRRKLKQNFIIGMGVFVLFSAPWIAALSKKYGHFTINTTGAYNHAVVGPTYGGHPMPTEGLMPPANSTALSVWEDPAGIPVRKWSPLGSFAEFRHQIMLVLSNLAALADSYQGMTFFAFIGLAGFLVMAFEPAGDIRLPLFCLSTFVVYSLGYIPIVVRARYLYINYILLFLMCGHLLTALFKNAYFDGARKSIMLWAFCLSFLVAPGTNIAANINAGRDSYMIGRSLKERFTFDGNIASNGMWMQSLYLTYYTGGQYYGVMRKGSTKEDVERELQANRIKYFLVWRNESAELAGWQDIPDVNIPGLRILVPLSAP